MWWRVKQWLIQHVAAHAYSYGILIFVLIMGLSAGAATARSLAAGTDKSWALAELAAGYDDGWSGFLSALWLTLRLYLVILICTAGWGGAAFSTVIVGVRGFLSGFGMGLMVSALGAQGWLLTLIALLPAAALINGAQVIAAATSIELALMNIRNGFRSTLAQKINGYLPAYLSILAMCLITVAASALEAGMMPLLLRWLP